jgi:plasmid replication initiation protein
MDSDLIVKKPDELVKMRGEFSESALKLSTYLISILKENTYIYNISVRNYLEKFDKTLGDFNKLYYTALELTRKQFKMVDRVNKRFAIYNFFSRAKYKDGILTIKIDDEFHQYLMLIKNNYLRYQIKNIMLLNSKYAIRLYEILKNKYEKTKKFQKDIFLKIKVDELRELLAVPLSYKYNMFKRRVLGKAQEEINEKTDIVFSFEEKKKGRKVDEIIFIIKSKYSNKKENKQIKTNFKQFRQDILSKAFAVKGFTEALINDFRINAPHLGVSLVMPGHIGTSISENSGKVLGQKDIADLNDDELQEMKDRWIKVGAPVHNLSLEMFRESVMNRQKDFKEKAITSAEAAAKVILEGVKAKEWRILIGPDAKALDRRVRENPEKAYDHDFLPMRDDSHFNLMKQLKNLSEEEN